MSLDNHLIHTCVIENPANSATNAYNNKVKAYAAPLEGVRCRLIEDLEYAHNDETAEGFMRSVYKLMVSAAVDLQERARITSVMLDGALLEDVFEVKEVLTRRGRNAHHKTAVLERIS